MRKFFISLLGVGLVSAVIYLSTDFVFSQEEVLGDSSSPSLSIPPTPEGPGLVLPDSPLYFLDRLKQEFRLALAFTPEAKAKIYANIAGERLAELRLMLIKKNQAGMQTALNGVSYNFAKAAESIADAELTGRDISKLAENIHTSIKAKQDTLDQLENQAGVVLKPQVAVVTQALLGAKVKVEASLPSTLIANAVRDDVDRLVSKNLNSASDLAKNLDKQIMQLQKQASDSSKTSLSNREEALRKAMVKKDEAMIKQQQRMLEEDRKKLQKLLELQEKAAKEAREASKKLQEATNRYKELQELINKLRNQSGITTSPTPIPSTSSGTTTNTTQ